MRSHTLEIGCTCCFAKFTIKSKWICCGSNEFVGYRKKAIWYRLHYDRSSGKDTASGESLNESAHTAAHRTLPLNTVVEVTNNRTGQKTLVRINDRGPFVDGRIIDLTPAAARALGVDGLARVSLEVVSLPDEH